MGNDLAYKVRKDFPLLNVKFEEKDLIYFDNAASVQKPEIVLRKMQDFYVNYYSNVHRAFHFLANKATDDYENTRKSVKDFINAYNEQEIIFTKNATEAINLVAYSWGFKNLKPDDEIILSILEHHANIVPWHFLREKLGVKLRFVKLTPELKFDFEDYQKKINKNTKLIALTHMSNVTGEILPVESIVSEAHKNGIPILLDGSQFVMHNKLDIQHLKPDFYIFTGHKLYGPTGIGVLWAKYDILSNMPPFLGGGEMIETVTKDKITYNDSPLRFEAGTPMIAEAVGLKAALEYIKNIGQENIAIYENYISKYFYAKLLEVPDIILYSNAQSAGVFSFNIKNIHPHDLALFLNNQCIAIRSGTHCAQILMEELGIVSCARASVVFYNTIEEIDFFINQLKSAHKFFIR